MWEKVSCGKLLVMLWVAPFWRGCFGRPAFWWGAEIMGADVYDAVMRCGNAAQIQRMMDKADLGLVIFKSGPQWVVTAGGHIIYSGDFARIRRRVAQMIADIENQSISVVMGG